MKKIILFTCLFYNVISASSSAGILVLQSDFGVKDAAVAEMKGTALTVDENIKIIDNTHIIEPFDIWEGAYRLFQSLKTFPKNTVFVSVMTLMPVSTVLTDFLSHWETVPHIDLLFLPMVSLLLF